eukprot:430183_1
MQLFINQIIVGNTFLKHKRHRHKQIIIILLLLYSLSIPSLLLRSSFYTYTFTSKTILQDIDKHNNSSFINKLHFNTTINITNGNLMLILNSELNTTLLWFYIRVTGPEMIVLDEINKNTWTGTVLSPGNYIIEIYIERTKYDLYDATTWDNGDCYPLHKKRGLIKKLPFSLQNNLNKANTLCSLKYKNNFTSFLSAINNGRFVKQNKKVFVRQLKYDWSPYDCLLDQKWLISPDIRILFIGDCTISEIVISSLIISYTNTIIVPNDFCYVKYNGNNSWLRQFDTMRCNNSKIKWNVEKIWNGGTGVVGNHQGLLVLKNESWMSQIWNYSFPYPQIVFVNSGLHDM